MAANLDAMAGESRAAFGMNTAGLQMVQFLSMVVAPSGIADPGSSCGPRPWRTRSPPTAIPRPPRTPRGRARQPPGRTPRHERRAGRARGRPRPRRARLRRPRHPRSPRRAGGASAAARPARRAPLPRRRRGRPWAGRRRGGSSGAFGLGRAPRAGFGHAQRKPELGAAASGRATSPVMRLTMRSRCSLSRKRIPVSSRRPALR